MVRKQPTQEKSMRKKPAVRQDDPEQSKRFLEGAREDEADETADGANKAFKAVVKPRKASKGGPMNQKRTPGSRSDKGPTPEKGGPARRMSTREAMAMRRRDALVEKLLDE